MKWALFFLYSLSVMAMEPAEHVRSVIDDLLETTHHHLIEKTHGKYKYELYEIDDPQYFFVSNMKLSRVLFGINHYRIGYNPTIFDKNIPEDALRGVLAHELNHSEDYVFGSSLGTIIPIGVKVSFKKSRAQYERKTDLKVIMKGMGKELLAYKHWQYPQLSSEMIERKKREYLTPEEIELAMSIQEAHPEILKSWLKKKIPRNLEEMKKMIASALSQN